MLWTAIVIIFLVWLFSRLIAIGFQLSLHAIDLILIVVFVGLVYRWLVPKNRGGE